VSKSKPENQPADPTQGTSDPSPSPSDDPDGKPPPPAGLWSRWSSSRLLIWSLLLLGGNFLIQMSVFTLTDDLFLPVAAGSLLGIVLPCVFVARSGGGTMASEFHLGPAPRSVLFWAAIAALAALLPTSLLAEISVRIHPISESWLDFYLERMPDGVWDTAMAAVTVILLSPVAEELLFRGILHRLASRVWGALPATIISALAFALIHGEPWYLFGLFGLGVLLAFIYEVTRSVTACAVTHAIHNMISLVLLLGENDPTASGTGAMELDVILLGGSLLLLALACSQLARHGAATRH